MKSEEKRYGLLSLFAGRECESQTIVSAFQSIVSEFSSCHADSRALLLAKHQALPVEACDDRLNEVRAESLFVEKGRHQLAERCWLDVALLPQRVHGHAESEFLVEGLLIGGQPRKPDEKSATPPGGVRRRACSRGHVPGSN
jgi:hypothetical protein